MCEDAVSEAREALLVLERLALPRLLDLAGELTHDGVRWRFAEERPFQIILLKLVRAVSGLNAALALQECAHTAETAVLIRAIHEYLEDVGFLVEMERRPTPTSDQRKYVELYFTEHLDPEASMRRGVPKRDRVARSAIRAANARLILPENVDRFQKLSAIPGDAYSGAVHAAYQPSMELYEPALGKFRVSGTRGTPYPDDYLREIVRYVHRTVNTFLLVAQERGLADLERELRSRRRRLELTTVVDRQLGNL